MHVHCHTDAHAHGHALRVFAFVKHVSLFSPDGVNKAPFLKSSSVCSDHHKKAQRTHRTAIVYAAHAVACLERRNYLKYRQAAFISVSFNQLWWGQKGNQCIY